MKTQKQAPKQNLMAKKRSIASATIKKPTSIKGIQQKENIPRNLPIPTKNQTKQKGKPTILATERGNKKSISRNQEIQKISSNKNPENPISPKNLPSSTTQIVTSNNSPPQNPYLMPSQQNTITQNILTPDAKPIEIVKTDVIPNPTPEERQKSQSVVAVQPQEFPRFKRKFEDSENRDQKIKKMMEMQEELKKQIEEKKKQKELEKLREKQEIEKEEKRIQNEKKELEKKYQIENNNENSNKKGKTQPKEFSKIFQPSEDNSFAIRTPLKAQDSNSVEIDDKKIIKELEKRIKTLEIERDNAIKAAQMYKEQLIKERNINKNCYIMPINKLHEESLESSTKFIPDPLILPENIKNYSQFKPVEPIKTDEYFNMQKPTEILQENSAKNSRRQKSKRYSIDPQE